MKQKREYPESQSISVLKISLYIASVLHRPDIFSVKVPQQQDTDKCSQTISQRIIPEISVQTLPDLANSHAKGSRIT